MSYTRAPLRTIAALLFGTIFSTLFVLSAPIVHADEGPGLGNLSYPASDDCRRIATIDTPQGEGAMAMHHGFLFVAWAPDSGKTGGGFDFYNMSNPRTPVRTFRRTEADIREPHGFGFSDSYTQGNLAVLQAQLGIQIWNFTNHSAPARLSYLTLTGISRDDDYNDGVWWAFWQAPYIYVGGSGNGIYVVDATNPTAPSVVTRVSTPTRVGPVFAIGNLLVATNNDSGGNQDNQQVTGRILTYDISNPRSPQLVTGGSLVTPRSYSSMVNGNRVFQAGADDDRPELLEYRINANNTVTEVRRTSLRGKGGYLSVQDNFVHMGASEWYQKINISTGAKPCEVQESPTSADWDFATALGNIVIAGNDHGEGSPVIVHQTAPDTTGPSVNMVNPRDGTTDQALTTRVGITLTDAIEVGSINSSNFIVRRVGTTTPLAGKYSTMFGIVNFSPNSALEPGRQYEVIVTAGAGAMKDYAGNTVSSEFRSVFTTGGVPQDDAPTCTLAASRPGATPGNAVAFSPASTTGTGLSYLWSFGDGATATTRDASHAYAAIGHYPVSLRVSNARGNATCNARQTIHTPLTATPPRNSSTVVFDQPRNSVWVVNSDTDTVTKINNAVNPPAKTGEFAVGDNPQSVARAPDGRIWVTNKDSGTISILNGDTGAVAATVQTGRGSRPHGLAFSPDNNAAYVTLEGLNTLRKLNPTTGATISNVNVGPWPRGIAISGDSSRVFVTRFVSPATMGGNDTGEVREVNASAMTVTRTVTLRNDPGPDTESSGRGVPNYIGSATISPDGRRLWVPSKKDNTSRGLQRDGQDLTFESTVRTVVSQIDLSTNAEVTGARLDLNDRDLANVVAFSPLGDYAFISTQGTNTIEVFDTLADSVVGGSGGQANNRRGPRGLAVASGNRLYMQNFISRTVSVWDITPVLNGTNNNPSLDTTIISVNSETLPDNVLDGKRIFYNAADLRMSRDGYISCASCHNDGGQDGRVFDFTDRGEGFRNTADLNGKAGMGQGRVHWTGNFNEIQDFCNDIKGPFSGTGFGTGCNAPLGAANAGAVSGLDNLAAFVASLNKVGPSPFRNQDGTMTADAVAGQQLFQQLQCNTCHVPATSFTDSVVGSDVRNDVGTAKPTSGCRLGKDSVLRECPVAKFDTPTLIGVWNTAPYLHDGSAPTLLDVLTTQNTRQLHGATAGLSATQLDQLVAYMQQLEDVAVPTNLVISNLNNRDTANPEWSIQQNLQNGQNTFGDRTTTWNTVGTLAGSQWIRTAADSKAFAGNPLVSFSINIAADVYVAIDNRITTLPSWLTDGSWADAGFDTKTSEGGTIRTQNVFKRRFNPGTVNLGPQNNSAAALYSVIVKP